MKTTLRKALFCMTLPCVVAFAVAAQQPQLVVQTGHSIFVNSVAFSPNGRVVASGSWDQTIKLWETATGNQLRSLIGHAGPVASVAFSPDGSVIASTGKGEKVVRLWDAATGKQLRSLVGHTGEVSDVKFSPTGNVIASGSADKTVKLWDAATGKELRSLEGHADEVTSIAFSPDGKVIASGSSDKTIKLWEVSTGEQLRSLLGDPSSVAFSPDGKMIANGSGDGTIKLWDAVTGKQVRSFEGHAILVTSVAFSPDGRVVATSGGDGTIKLWDAATGAQLRSLEAFGVMSVAFSPDGTAIASGGQDLQLWDAIAGTPLRSLEAHAKAVSSGAFSPDGSMIASASGDHTIKLWDAATGTQLRIFEDPTSSCDAVTFSPDQRVIACSGITDNSIVLWDAATGKQIRSLVADGGVHSIAFSPDGKLIASGSGNGTITLWEAATGRQLRSLAGHSAWVTSVAFSPDGKTIASGGLDQTIKLWDPGTGNQLRSLEGHAGHVYAVTFSPDGKVIVSGNADKTIRLWEAATGNQIRSLEGHADEVTSVAFSPDGQMIASGSTDKTINLWDAVTGKRLRSLADHAAIVSSVAFSPDGKTIVSCSYDATMKLWRPDSDKPLATLIALDKDNWAVVTADNRFDTRSLENIEGLHWVMPDGPFTTLPLEIFMRDYYEPRLLPRILKCNAENDCDQEFKPVRDISKLNRVQPLVQIAGLSQPDADGYVTVTVEVGKGEGQYLINGQERTSTTSVYDVRLFRDGQMVGSWPYEGAEKLWQLTSADLGASEKLIGEHRLSKELLEWRQATEIKPDNTAKRDKQTGMLTLPPFRVKLPRGKDASEIDFSAYAFNEDRIKSQTAHWQWPDDLKARLPKAQAVKPRAYIITVGVNAYENPDWNLKYAANDARQIQRTLVENLSQGSEYEGVVPVSLISDYQPRNGQNVVTEKSATKANIRAVLDLLAGKQVDPETLKNIPNAARLRKAEPDDLLIISFSSHGYADNRGNFYFIPYDVGTGSKQEITSDLLRHAISSEELSLWLHDVDAGDMTMIVDACHSAASVQGEGFKPGPMGSRGLGQLSYDKGIKILTATQSDDVALETDFTQQGLLTYALTHDGIEAGEADFKPRNKVITLAEWLEYGVDRVPKLYTEIAREYQTLALNELKSIDVGGRGRTKLRIFSRDGTNSSLKKGANQQPSLFDFTRTKRDVVLAQIR